MRSKVVGLTPTYFADCTRESPRGRAPGGNTCSRVAELGTARLQYGKPRGAPQGLLEGGPIGALGLPVLFAGATSGYLGARNGVRQFRRALHCPKRPPAELGTRY